MGMNGPGMFSDCRKLSQRKHPIVSCFLQFRLSKSEINGGAMVSVKPDYDTLMTGTFDK